MNMHDHEGWRIGVRLFQTDACWSAGVEVWQPGTSPRTHSGLPLPFTGRFDTAGEAEAAAVDQAKHWIDRQPA